jgi:hypothetical protein
MNCCFECFSSKYIQVIIHTNSALRGNCDYCNSINVLLYTPQELALFFQPFLELYSNDDQNGQPLPIQIEKDFSNKIFSSKVQANVGSLLRQIFIDEPIESDWAFENNVSLTCLREAQRNERVQPLQNSWENFAEEIKYTNRFHIKNTLDLGILEKILRFYEKPITRGKVFYRSRISSMLGFQPTEMANPPKEKTKSGRANPIGISYLYLSDSIQTTLYEARAALFDYITVAEFRLLENINVVNFRGDTYDPILLAEEGRLEEFMILLPFTSRLESELSRPRRRTDSDLDYLPTQYLSEFIKSLGYTGVEFKSSLYNEGYNLAIFEPEKFECIKCDVCEIHNIQINYTSITT